VSWDTFGLPASTYLDAVVSYGTKIQFMDRGCGVGSLRLAKEAKQQGGTDVTEYGGTYEERTDRFTALEERFVGYEVYDQSGEKIGKVDDLFVDDNNNAEYVGVKMGFLGTRSTLIPMDIITVDEPAGRLVTSADKETVKNGPTFDDDREIIPSFENEVYSYYGLQRASTESGAYETYQAEATASDVRDEDELRVQRVEEELAAGTREREAGALNVRKRVRTDREQIEVPTRHEEVTVERVPVSEGTASEAQIGDDEVSIPVTEEEVVVEKRPVAKEEVRIRKDVVEDMEVVEEDVRREEIDVDDQTTRGA
jgi:uncharacterized protein (TIGR02271 family)